MLKRPNVFLQAESCYPYITILYWGSYGNISILINFKNNNDQSKSSHGYREIAPFNPNCEMCFMRL